MKNLVIVESPSKSKTIEKYLGKDYKVVSSKGHIRDLATKGKEGLGVDVENEFKPTYVVSKDKKPVVKELKQLRKQAENVYLATDPDREGEAISWHLAQELDIPLDEKNRIEFHEITKNAVLKALNEPRCVDLALVKSQETRRIVDRIMGFKLSKLLQRKIKSQSAGRVQSVALRIICDREHEIEAFKPEEYWNIKATLIKDKKTIETSLTKEKGKKLEIKNEKQASDLVDRIKAPVVLKEIIEKKKKRASYLPFTTSTMQQEASSKLSFSSKKTMQVAQTLYEGVDLGNGRQGLITYMRTDSTRLSKEFVGSALNYIENTYGKVYVGKYRIKNDDNAQDAHEAIRPTSLENDPETIKDNLTNDQYKLYRFIYYRALASLMADAVNNTVTYNFEVDHLTLNATGSVLAFDGFLKVYEKYDSSKDVVLPKFKQDDEFDVEKIDKEQKFTEAPSRYTEAKLIKALEEEGVGRPSTYATIIDTIQKREYVKLEKSTETSKTKVFFPTEQGILTDNKLKEFFADFINVKYTAQMENDLDEIADSKKDSLQILKDFYDKLMPLMDNANANMEKIEPKKTGKKCPKCGNDLVIRKGRYGEFVACNNYPECKYIEKEEEEIEYVNEKCPECGSELIYKKGRYGRFIGCSNYPTCKFIKKDERNDAEQLKAGDACPQCGHELVEKMGRYGKFIACGNYPDCKFIVNSRAAKKAEPIGRKCPDCGGELLIRSSRRGDFIACSNFPKCRHTEKLEK